MISFFSTELSYDPAILVVGISAKELKAGTQINICTSMFTATWLIAAKRWEQPKSPLADGWKDKMRSVHTMEYDLA